MRKWTILLLVAGLSASSSMGQGDDVDWQHAARLIRLEHSSPSMTDFEQIPPVTVSPIHHRRSLRFSHGGGLSLDGPDKVYETRSAASTPDTSLPFGASDVVLLGTVRDYQSYLSADGSEIWTEWIIDVEKLFGTPPLGPKAVSPAFRVDDTVTALRSGGALRTKSHELRSQKVGWGYPRVLERCFFFLKADDELPGFQVVTVYLVREGRVFPLDRFVRKGSQEALLPFAGELEEDFLARLQALGR